MITSEKITLNQGNEIVSNNEKYHQNLDSILSRQLSPENIFTYAVDALDDVISLAQTVVTEYAATENLPQTNMVGRELEEAAFKNYGLDDIGTILDYIADRADDVNKIKNLISRANIDSRIILPPNKQDTEISKEYVDGSFTEKQTIPRLETVLMILKNFSDIDIEDESQCQITSGVVDPKMMRQQTYYMVEVPSVNRLLFVNNEEQNATYVFDTSILLDKDLTINGLANKTKCEINEIIDQNNGIGKKYIYNKNFVSRIEKSIEYDLSTDVDDEVSNNDESGKYLKSSEHAPDGFMTLTAIAKRLVVSNKTVRAAIENLGEDFGRVERYISNRNNVPCYSLEQQDMIRLTFQEKGLLVPDAPEGYLPLYAIAKSLSVGYPTICAVVKSLGKDLGSAEKYLFGSKRAPGYSPEQQDIMRLKLQEKGLLVPDAPEGYMSLNAIATGLGVDYKTVSAAIENLGEDLGEVKNYLSGVQRAPCYSPEQQDIMRLKLQEKGLLVPDAPEGYLPLYAISKSFGVGSSTVRTAIENLGEDLGKVEKYRFTSQRVPGYSPEQQKIITDKFAEMRAARSKKVGTFITKVTKV